MGFTLIEMLVVVAIILTLLGILLPAIEGARDRAYVVVCGNNLHQIGLAMRLYLDESNGYFPGTGCPEGAAPGGTPDTWITYTWGGATSCWHSPFNWVPVWDKRSQLFTYASSKNIFLCPVDAGVHDGQPQGNMTGLSYVMNGEFSGNWGSILHRATFKISSVRNGALSNYIVIYEGTGYDTHSDTGAQLALGQQFLANWHNGKAGLLYADGHVEFHAMSKSIADSGIDPLYPNAASLCVDICPSVRCPFNGNGIQNTWGHSGGVLANTNWTNDCPYTP